MAKKPKIAHQVIVDYILSGHSTREAKNHFGFPNDNVANLRIWAAFKHLGLKRPRYAKERKCKYCGKLFLARNYKQKTCGEKSCQTKLIVEWNRSHPESSRVALAKYRKTEKGRQNNLRMHAKRRAKRYGSAPDKWNFAADECKKSLRKRKHLATRNPWNYRIEHIQKMAQVVRVVSPRRKRSVEKYRKEYRVRAGASEANLKWYSALRAMDTVMRQMRTYAINSAWESLISKIQASLRSNWRIQQWKRKKHL